MNLPIPEPEPFRESNDCHNPPGDGGGQFCSKGGTSTPRLSWGTPVKTEAYGGRMLDLRPQVTKGELVIGQRFEKREGVGYGGVMVIEFGRVLKVMKGAVDIERPDGTKTRLNSKIATYRRPEEKETAEEVWRLNQKKR